MNNNKYFDDTLGEFYENSNEIEVHCKIFNESILRKLNQFSELNWLEVGIGKGEKLLEHLKSIDSKPNLTIIEPSEKWITQLIQSQNLNKIKTLTRNITIYNTSFENFNQNLYFSEFDYISFNQVLYNEKIVNSLFDFIESRKNEKPYELFINLENKTSDLYKLRELFTSEYPDLLSSQISKITNFFEVEGISFESIVTKNKILSFDLEKLKFDLSYWLYPFVLGIDKPTFKKIEQKEKQKIRKLIIDFINHKTNLKIDDTTLIAQIN